MAPKYLVTRPQFKTCLYTRSIYSQHHSHNSSHVHQYFLHPHFKMQGKDTTQAGTQSVVCLSGLELTVKHTQTPFCFFGISFIYIVQNSTRTVPVQPQLLSWISRVFTFIILVFLSPRYPYKEPANRHLVMESKCK